MGGGKMNFLIYLFASMLYAIFVFAHRFHHDRITSHALNECGVIYYTLFPKNLLHHRIVGKYGYKPLCNAVCEEKTTDHTLKVGKAESNHACTGQGLNGFYVFTTWLVKKDQKGERVQCV
jgi:hypothetical protein